ncbi:MAG: membrane protein insertion efficiency factor YidD [Anaerolineaceae bacterium]
MVDQPVKPIEHEHADPRIRDLPFKFKHIPRVMLLFLIKAYQVIVSPALPPGTCRYYPTCSHYGYQAVYRYGALKGSWMAIKRIVRCNPFHEGGYDPVP